jgi:uncharacterized repeat protein (TIGR04076 family)
LKKVIGVSNLGGEGTAMKHECKITVLETKCFPELQEQYLADPKSGPCPFFKPGDTFLLKRTPQQDDFYHLMNGKYYDVKLTCKCFRKRSAIGERV